MNYIGKEDEQITGLNLKLNEHSLCIEIETIYDEYQFWLNDLKDSYIVRGIEIINNNNDVLFNISAINNKFIFKKEEKFYELLKSYRLKQIEVCSSTPKEISHKITCNDLDSDTIYYITMYRDII